MEHQDRYAEQKVLPVINPSTLQSLIENEFKPAGNCSSMGESENEDRIQSTSFQDIPHTPRQSSSHYQDQTSFPSNNAPHNFPINKHIPDQVKTEQPAFTPSGPRLNLNFPPVAPSEVSPTPHIANSHAFNANNTNIEHVNNTLNLTILQLAPIPEEDDRGININQEEEREPCSPLPFHSGNVPMTPTTKLDLAPFTEAVHKLTQAISTSSSTFYIQEGGIPVASVHTGHASATTAGRSGEQGTVPPLAFAPTYSTLPESLRGGMGFEGVDENVEPKVVGKSFADRVKQSVRSSLKSGLSTKRLSSIVTLRRSQGAYQTLKPVKRVPVVTSRGEKRELPKDIEVYMHAELDPFPGNQRLILFKHPSMIHCLAGDGSLPEVFSVNIYDVGYFDGGGNFILLFNLQMTMEQNEEKLNIKFKTISFLPITHGEVQSSPISSDKFLVWNDRNILIDKISPVPNGLTSRGNMMCRFSLRPEITQGTAIVLLGKVKRYFDALDVLRTERYYFEAHCLDWYRYAKGERNYNIENGDLVLITECYKVPSWGNINYQCEEGTPRGSWAAFHPVSGGKYGWECATPPLPGLYVTQHQSTEADATAGLPDQCIGVRGYRISCHPRDWKPLCKELEAARELEAVRRRELEAARKKELEAARRKGLEAACIPSSQTGSYIV